jgi:hypothetical protein
MTIKIFDHEIVPAPVALERCTVTQVPRKFDIQNFGVLPKHNFKNTNDSRIDKINSFSRQNIGVL